MIRGNRIFNLVKLFGILLIVVALANTAYSQNNSRRRQGPPPEAYTACEGKNAGDEAQFVSPRGDTVTGTCVEKDDRLVLRPDRSKGRSGGRRQGPPPEAYSACEGKNVGDTAEFVSPHGDTVTGTCEQFGDQLALRPERGKGHAGGKPRNNFND